MLLYFKHAGGRGDTFLKLSNTSIEHFSGWSLKQRDRHVHMQIWGSLLIDERIARGGRVYHSGERHWRNSSGTAKLIGPIGPRWLSGPTKNKRRHTHIIGCVPLVRRYYNNREYMSVEERYMPGHDEFAPWQIDTDPIPATEIQFSKPIFGHKYSPVRVFDFINLNIFFVPRSSFWIRRGEKLPFFG